MTRRRGTADPGRHRGDAVNREQTGDAMVIRDKRFIAGDWVAPSKDETIVLFPGYTPPAD